MTTREEEENAGAYMKIRGQRPSPLKIKKESHLIQKRPSSPAAAQKRQPVIIYTHSPKVIHTQARDFMALVQKLTGLSPRPQPQNTTSSAGISNASDDNESSSVLTDDNTNNNNIGNTNIASCASIFSNPYFADIPLFTPNAANLFYSPRPGCRIPGSDTAFASPNMGGSISPSVLDFAKRLQQQEY